MMALGGRPLAAADLRHDGNIFTALRWLLATSVMFSHGWDLTQPRPGLDPSVPVLTVTVSWLAVSLFFTLSGFLVTGSLLKRGAADFAAARALRLLPGLWTMIVVVVVGLWALFGTTSLGAYLIDPLTLRYALRNALTLGGEYRLPGMFAGQPVAAVNGSLWTIPQEVRCYAALALLALAGVLASRRVVAAAFAVAVIVHVALPLDLVPALIEPRRLALSFFLGVVAYQWRERLRLSWPLALAGAAVAVALAHVPVGRGVAQAGLQFGFGYLVVVAAFAVPAGTKALSAALPDYSYGIYIYAFPAQQLALALGAGTTPLANIAIGLTLTLPLASLSWHLVEKPALALKPRLMRRTRIEVSV